MTLRDDVWNSVLRQCIETGKFKISDLPFKEGQRHTTRRVLREMEELDWLSRESEKSAIWRIGPKARLHLNVSTDLIERSREGLDDDE